jgi:hypothetical protein
VASSPPDEAIAVLSHIGNLRGSALPWYFGSGVALYCGGQGASYRLSANVPFASMVPYCGGGCGWGLGCLYA